MYNLLKSPAGLSEKGLYIRLINLSENSEALALKLFDAGTYISSTGGVGQCHFNKAKPPLTAEKRTCWPRTLSYIGGQRDHYFILQT